LTSLSTQLATLVGLQLVCIIK